MVVVVGDSDGGGALMVMVMSLVVVVGDSDGGDVVDGDGIGGGDGGGGGTGTGIAGIPVRSVRLLLDDCDTVGTLLILLIVLYW